MWQMYVSLKPQYFSLYAFTHWLTGIFHVNLEWPVAPLMLSVTEYWSSFFLAGCPSRCKLEETLAYSWGKYVAPVCCFYENSYPDTTWKEKWCQFKLSKWSMCGCCLALSYQWKSVTNMCVCMHIRLATCRCCRIKILRVYVCRLWSFWHWQQCIRSHVIAAFISVIDVV